MGAGRRMLEGRNGRNQFDVTSEDLTELRDQIMKKRMSLAIRIVEDKYPNGTPNKTVFVGEIQIGTLSCVDDGFKGTGWREAVAPLDVAIKKLRTEAITDRQEQILRLQQEIDSLKD